MIFGKVIVETKIDVNKDALLTAGGGVILEKFEGKGMMTLNKTYVLNVIAEILWISEMKNWKHSSPL